MTKLNVCIHADSEFLTLPSLDVGHKFYAYIVAQLRDICFLSFYGNRLSRIA